MGEIEVKVEYENQNAKLILTVVAGDGPSLLGISSAPAMFQKVMDTILQGAPQTLCFIDDILITGTRGGAFEKP